MLSVSARVVVAVWAALALALWSGAATTEVGAQAAGSCESLDTTGMQEEDACRLCALPPASSGVTGSCALCVERRNGNFFGCVSSTNNTVCQDPDDDLFVGPGSCRDRCDNTQTKNCNNCLEARAGGPAGSCGWCESGSRCITGSKAGPWDPAMCDAANWRQANASEANNQPYVNYQCTQPSNRVPCAQQTECSSCRNSAEAGSNGYDPCVWCSTPSGDNQESGSCSAASANAACAGTRIDHTAGREACPFNAAPTAAAPLALIAALLALALALL